MVRWSGPAKKDLRRIFDYIAEDSIYNANSVVQTIVDKSESLNAFPQMAERSLKLENPMFRKYLFTPLGSFMNLQAKTYTFWLSFMANRI